MFGPRVCALGRGPGRSGPVHALECELGRSGPVHALGHGAGRSGPVCVHLDVDLGVRVPTCSLGRGLEEVLHLARRAWRGWDAFPL